MNLVKILWFNKKGYDKMIKNNDYSLNLVESSKLSKKFLDSIADGIKNSMQMLRAKIDNCQLEITNMKKTWANIEMEEDKVWGVFSPVKYGNEMNPSDIEAEIAFLQLKLNEYVTEYDKLLLQIKELNVVKQYLMKLENVIVEISSNNMMNNVNEVIANEDILHKDNVKYDRLGIKLLKTQELERKRIARDLHDTTVQNLTSLIYKTELCEKYVDIDNIRVKLELEIMKKTLRTTIQDMREIIYDLRPMNLDDLGLISSVERYIDQAMRSSGIIIHFEVEEENFEFNKIVSSTLMRIVQEATNNAIKHSKADTLNISIKSDEENIILTIIDDGIGFDTKKFINNKHKVISNFGLSVMRERVNLLSGLFEIDSKKNIGTKITISVPISLNTEDM